MGKDAPIGVFDSGVGGLSVLAEIQQLLPHESLLYVADCGHIPYGEKTPAFILERSRSVAEFFRRAGRQGFCDRLQHRNRGGRRGFAPGLPRLAPGGHGACGQNPPQRPRAVAWFGVLATTGTLQSAKFAALLDRFATDVRVITQPCPGLVELIETGDLDSPPLTSVVAGLYRPAAQRRL